MQTKLGRSRSAIGSNTAFSAALAVLALIVVFALVAPLFVDPYGQHLTNQLAPPSRAHFFGTDELGRDIFSRVLYGARVSLLTGALATLISVIGGLPLGLIAGYLGKGWDASIMRVVDFLIAVPAVILAMVFVAILGRNSINSIIAIGIIGIPPVAMLTRAGTLSIKQQEYVIATQVLGERSGRLLFGTILPNVATPVIAQMAVFAESAIVLEAALNFLGLGNPPPAPSWGELLSASQGYLYQAPWYGIFPGLALMVLVLVLDVLARGLQRMLQGGQ